MVALRAPHAFIAMISISANDTVRYAAYAVVKIYRTGLYRIKIAYKTLYGYVVYNNFI